ncbi:diguanylate cyclase domain-containing protein [Paenibacillus sp. R14(2021)]|uniref:diguanylate cyclase domain-containing protein n=1 Tax=Paenibacillus sp. R14(2021) TaxID=2859228 RepID=UPI001C612171|nr:diguanylate cyclase [Paenibacillus sp. R14(2021)]
MNNQQAAATPAYTLFTLQASPSQRRFAFIIGAIVAAITLAGAPYAHLRFPRTGTLQPALFAAVICFELITVFVLYSQFRVCRAPSILVLAAGYLYSAGMATAYLLTFPGTLEHRPPLWHAEQQVPEYLYAFWHAGFPIAILLHVFIEKKYGGMAFSPRQGRNWTALVFGGTLLLVALITTGVIRAQRSLPVVMDHGRITPFFLFAICLPVLLISLAALIAYFRSTRGSTVTASWLCVALLATLLDVGIVLCGGERFSLGWYISKMDTFVCANIVLAGMIYEFTKMYYRMTELYNQVTDSESRFKKLFVQSRIAEQKIAEQNKIIERMLESGHEAIAMCDEEGRVLFANQRFADMFGRTLAAGQQLADYCRDLRVSYGTLDRRIEAYFEQRLPPFRERAAFQLEGGAARYYECYVSPIASEDGQLLHGHLFMFSDRTDEERKAHYDDLTGLPNRRYISQRIQEAVNRGREENVPFAVFFMDLDGFKRVNDTLGHEMGDRLLQETAVILRDCVGTYGISARWAGDEFVVLIEEAADTQLLDSMARAIIAAMGQLDRINGQRINVSASIGIAVFPQDGGDAAAILQRADQAMYEAKTRGKNDCWFYADCV